MSEAPDVIETEDDATSTESANTADTQAPAELDETELEAIAMGWKPQSEFKGPDDKFVSAADYLERGKSIMPFLRKDLAAAYKKIEGLEKAVSKSVDFISRAEQRGYEKARKDLEAELDAAAEAGNAADVRAITKDIVDLEREVAAKPDADAAQAEAQEQFAAWKAENPWYDKDPEMAAEADAIGNELFNRKKLSGQEQGAEVTRRIKLLYPDRFTNPNRRLPGAVEGGGAAPGPRGKSYSDLPAEAKQMCDEFVRDIKGFTREKYVRDYFKS